MPDLILPIDEHTSAVIRRLADFLSERIIQAYLVGGYVRNVLLNRYTQDIDIALSGDATVTAKEIAMLFGGKFVLLDDINKVARVVMPELYLDFSTIKNDIEDDLKRRDFTINAMAQDLNQLTEHKTIIDPCNGQSDIRQKTIKATSDDVFRQDPVRLMRAIRLAAELNFDIDDKTQTLIKRDAHLVANVAGERICDEFCAAMATDQAYSMLRLMDDLGLIAPLLPELDACKGVEQPKEHSWDVFDHSIETVTAVDKLFANIRTQQNGLSEIPWTDELAYHFSEQISSGHLRMTILKIAALLHDIGKPSTKSIQENGRMRFLGHSSQSAKIAKSIMTRLRFSVKEIKTAQRIIEQHMRPTQLSNNWEMPTRRAIYRFYRDTEDDAFDILLLSLADHLAARGPLLEKEHWSYHIALIKYVMLKHSQEQDVVKPTKLIDGNDLIKLGVKPGPEIGMILETVREAQATGEIATKDDAINLAKRLFN
ncbi:CCA tRNA nucleotidyltransferase [Chloroflexota bacterium]